MCNRFELPMKKQIKEFSTGMRAKLKLIVAATHDASLLILDEPTAGLDVIARGECFAILRNFLEKREDNYGAAAAALMGGAYLALIALSYRLSVRIVEKKEL